MIGLLKPVLQMDAEIKRLGGSGSSEESARAQIHQRHLGGRADPARAGSVFESGGRRRRSSTRVQVWTDGDRHLLTDPWPQHAAHGVAKDGVPITVKLGRRELRVTRVLSTYQVNELDGFIWGPPRL